MSTRPAHRYWLLWMIASIGLTVFLTHKLLAGADKTLFMPGPLSPGHHQLAEACDTCHTQAYGGGEVLQEACIDCHAKDRVKPFDSHPRTKFTDPRNADRLEQINALECVSCHTEHRPEITLKDGLTQPLDVCFHCHADIAEERPSHAGMEFDTCKSSGCHNFHNNRALYTDFLLKHLDAPDTNGRPRVPTREFGSVFEEILEYPRERYPVERLTHNDHDAVGKVAVDGALLDEWAATAHAAAGVNCSACHQPPNAAGEPGPWTDYPGQEGCVVCHNLEVQRFGEGKHGMRLAAGLPPMTPHDALLPMKAGAAHTELTCATCHGAHDFDVTRAAVEGCLECHDDPHSLAYDGSPHHELWVAERGGEGKPDTGVSCATCHMPRVDFDVNDWMSRTLVDHNQSAALSPSSKMIRPACLHCHGLGFAIDALADQELVDRNFPGPPGVHVDSMEMARKDHERYLREKEQASQ